MTADARELAVHRYVTDPSLSNRNALVTAHRYLCRRGARKFYRGTVDRADLEQVAAIGLIKACERYSRSYDTPFEAYAWLVIVGELMHFVRDHEHIVRIPRTLRALDARYNGAYETLAARLGHEPSPQQLAAELQIPLRVVDQLRALRNRSLPRDRADLRAGNADFPEAPPEPEPGYAIEDHLTLAQALHALSHRELKIIRGVFFREQTQGEVGRDLGLSQRQVSRILGRALDRLSRFVPV